MVSPRVQVENGGVLLLGGGNLVRVDVVAGGGDIQSSGDGNTSQCNQYCVNSPHSADDEYWRPPTVIVSGLNLLPAVRACNGYYPFTVLGVR